MVLICAFKVIETIDLIYDLIISKFDIIIIGIKLILYILNHFCKIFEENIN